MNKMTQVVITGVAGFIGSTLAEKLLHDGHNVRGIDSFTNYYPLHIKEKNIENCLKHPNFSLIRQDLESSLDLSTIFKNTEYIFHLAAQPGVRASWGKEFAIYVKNNISVTQKILESLKNNTTLKKFVLASSSSVYGNQSSIMNEETSLTRPVSPYGVTKLAAENLANLYFKNYKIPTVSLRYFTVYGPKQRPDMAFTRFFNSIIKDKKLSIFGNGEQTRDFTYVDDIVKATINAATSDSVGEILNVGGGSVFSLSQIIEFMKEITEKEFEIDFNAEQKGDVKHTSADISKAKKLINYKSNTDIKYGLTQQYEYIKTNLNLYDGIINHT
jgi:UDP-glucose 4-epimerase